MEADKNCKCCEYYDASYDQGNFFGCGHPKYYHLRLGCTPCGYYKKREVTNKKENDMSETKNKTVEYNLEAMHSRLGSVEATVANHAVGINSRVDDVERAIEYTEHVHKPWLGAFLFGGFIVVALLFCGWIVGEKMIRPQVNRYQESKAEIELDTLEERSDLDHRLTSLQAQIHCIEEGHQFKYLRYNNKEVWIQLDRIGVIGTAPGWLFECSQCGEGHHYDDWNAMPEDHQSQVTDSVGLSDHFAATVSSVSVDTNDLDCSITNDLYDFVLSTDVSYDSNFYIHTEDIVVDGKPVKDFIKDLLSEVSK